MQNCILCIMDTAGNHEPYCPFKLEQELLHGPRWKIPGNTGPRDLTATEFDELRTAEYMVRAYTEAIQKEMLERANQGIFWQNDMFKSWPDYANAVAKQNLLRAKYGV